MYTVNMPTDSFTGLLDRAQCAAELALDDELLDTLYLSPRLMARHTGWLLCRADHYLGEAYNIRDEDMGTDVEDDCRIFHDGSVALREIVAVLRAGKAVAA